MTKTKEEIQKIRSERMQEKPMTKEEFLKYTEDLKNADPGNRNSDPKKVRVSMWMNIDTLNAIRARANETGSKYQTLINQTLREVFVQKSETKLSDRIDDICTQLSQMILSQKHLENDVEEIKEFNRKRQA